MLVSRHPDASISTPRRECMETVDERFHIVGQMVKPPLGPHVPAIRDSTSRRSLGMVIQRIEAITIT
jgi:hypothetical protein